MSVTTKIVPGVGVVHADQKILDALVVADTFTYSDWFDLKEWGLTRALIHVIESGTTYGLTYKVQGRMYSTASGEEQDLAPDPSSPEYEVAADASDYQTLDDGWAQIRIGYKNTVGGNAAEITAYIGAGK